ncbi:MAG: UvrB/UvrC motif-containing protein [Bacillota bacterium]
MRCEHCGEREATVHITTIRDGKKMDLHLCSDCAAEEGFFAWSFEPQFPVHGLLGGLMEKVSGGKTVSMPRTLECPACGRTYREFAQTGFLGCAQCYEAFSDAVGPLIKRMQSGSSHRGKRPGGGARPAADAGDDVRAEISTLRGRLQQAVQEEEYERAAELRDMIRELEAKRDD